MWLIVLACAAALTAAVNVRFWRALPPDADTTDFPAATALVPWTVAAWAGAITCWAVLAGLALDDERWGLAVLAACVGTAALIGPAGARIAGWSVRELVRYASAYSEREAYSSASARAHEAKSHVVVDPLPEAAAELRSALDALERALPVRHRPKRLGTVEAAHQRRHHTFEHYRNPLDGIRLWHTAGVEWLALDATLALRAAFVAAAIALPAGLTAGVTPSGAAVLPWLALTAWSVLLAAAAPVLASRAMTIVTRKLRETLLAAALVVEAALLVLALAVTPSWAVLVSLAVAWNCANRLGDGFSWSFKVPAVTGAAIAVALGSLLAHGAHLGAAAAEVAGGVIVAAVISNSFTLFAPASAFVIVALPLGTWRARRRVRGELAPLRRRALLAVDDYRRAADALAPAAAAWPRAEAKLIAGLLDESAPPVPASLIETVDAAVRDRLAAGREPTFGGTTAANGVRDARWRAPGGTAARHFAEAVGIIASEAAVHGTGQLEITLTERPGSLVLVAENRRRSPTTGAPRGGSADLRALSEALAADDLYAGPDPQDPERWLVTFSVEDGIIER